MRLKSIILLLVCALAISACTPPIIKLDNIQTQNMQLSNHSSKQIMVMLPLSNHQVMQNKIESIKQSYGIQLITSWPLKSINLYCVVFELNNTQATNQIVSDISREAAIDSVQQMQLFQVNTETERITSKSMKHLQNGIKRLNIEKAHTVATGKNVRIAIVDSGIDINHPEYKNTIEEVKNFVNKPSQSYTSDIHGTAIAGVIASENKTNHGIIGVSPDVKILAFKACWQTKDQWNKAYCTSFSLAKAINVAILRKVNILNLSLGGPYDAVIDKLIQKALNTNIAVVAASGSNNNPHISFPASIPGVIAVNASIENSTEDNNNLTRKPNKKLCAPSSNIITTIPGNSYDFFSGSSLATAFVSGTIALILEKSPKLTPSEIYNLLELSSTTDQTSPFLSVNSCSVLALLLNKDICN